MTIDIKNKKFVTIGNGTGQATILKHLRNYVDDLTVIVGVTDNGGHSGVLRRDMNIPAPGDIRNCLNALTLNNDIMSNLMSYRFSTGELKGASLGNLILSALIDIEGDLGKAVDELSKILDIKIKVCPATIESTQICAKIENGDIIEGEFEIIRRDNKDLRIVEMFHNPVVKAYDPCLAAIKTADVIIISPGTLRTGIISTLLAEGMQEAFQKTRAKIIFICNIMTNPGQTEGFSSQDHIDEIVRYTGRKPDYALVHDGNIPDFVQQIYMEERSYPVKHVNINHNEINIIIEDLLEEISVDEMSKYERILGKNIKSTPHIVRHDSKKVTDIIMSLSQC